jgi:phosphoglycolate phosphatase
VLKLLIFDLDGTLADTSQDIADALNYALRPFGVREYSVEETKAMVGSGISALLKSLLPEQPSEEQKREAEEGAERRFLEHYDNHLIDNTILYPGVKETLARLDTYRKAVLSNKRTKYSVQILRDLGIAGHFDLVWGSDSVREKKPSPVPIQDMLKDFGVSEREAAMIGDSNYDVEAGKAAGIAVIAVTYGFRSRELLEGADRIIDSFSELPGLLQQKIR